MGLQWIKPSFMDPEDEPVVMVKSFQISPLGDMVPCVCLYGILVGRELATEKEGRRRDTVMRLV